MCLIRWPHSAALHPRCTKHCFTENKYVLLDGQFQVMQTENQIYLVTEYASGGEIFGE